MLRHRKIILALSFAIVIGSISSAIGYAVYIRSDAYRKNVELRVGDYLGLRTQIERVTPLSGSTRKFSGIRIFLPETEKPTFRCVDAIWKINQGDNNDRIALDLYDGNVTLDTEELSPEKYRAMLSSGLGHDFEALGLATVQLYNFDIAWKRDEIGFVIQHAGGDVVFAPDGTGRANLTAKKLNGTELGAPLRVNALFTPGEGLRFHHVALDVPPVSLGVLGLDRTLGSQVKSGWFDGAITLRDKPGAQHITLRGALGEVRLEELTGSLLSQPVRGRVDVILDEATLSGGMLEGLNFRGSLSELRLEDLAKLVNVPGLTGLVNLRIQQARIVRREIDHASLTGDADNIPLEAISRLIGRGVVTGELQVRINGLLVENHNIKWADISIDAVNPSNKPGTISRDVVTGAAKDLLGVDLGRMAVMLPETIEYVELGLKVLVERGRLRFEGSHGQDGESILTIRDPILGRPMSVFSAPKQTYRLDDLIAQLRERMEAYDLEDVQTWWELRQQEEE